MSFVADTCVHEPLRSTSFLDEHISRKAALKEAKLLVHLAVPTIGIQLGSVLPPFLVASYVGRNFGSVYLDGFTLASLTGNLFTLSLMQGLFSAADTLSPQAFGANNEREVGLLAIRGYAGSLLIMIPVNIVLFFYMDAIMQSLGIDPKVSHLAWQWYQVYVCSLPFYALFQATWKFLSAQNVMAPCFCAVFFGSLVVLPISLVVWPPLLGYLGTALAILSFQVLEAISLVAYLWWRHPHSLDSWPGLGAWREALQWDRFSSFLALGLGGILASSEWIYWETMSLIIGTMGVAELSIHTIPTQIMMIGFMFPLGTGIALAIRMGNTLPRSTTRAKELALGCWLTSSVLFGIMAVLCYVGRFHLYSIFTHEAEIVQGAEEIWWDVSFFLFHLSMYGINMGISIGLGKQWALGAITVGCLWILGLPGAYYIAVVQGGGLPAAWKCIWPPYVAMNVLLAACFCLEDWEEISCRIRLREGIADIEVETQSLRRKEQSENGYGSTDKA